MRGIYTSTHLYVFMARCLVKHRATLTSPSPVNKVKNIFPALRHEPFPCYCLESYPSLALSKDQGVGGFFPGSKAVGA